MNNQIKAQYNSLYSAVDTMYDDGEPTKPVRDITKYITGGTVLDLGGGEGRNALYLARQGFSVEVWDLSEVGLEKIEKVAEAQKLAITTRVADITVEKISEMYDVVLFSFVLHHVDTEQARRVIKDAQQHTNTGGVHIISTFVNQGELYERANKTNRFYPNEATLRDLYNDWRIEKLANKETTTHARNKAGDRLKNHMITLIATK